MNTVKISSMAGAALLLLSPLAAFAHETQHIDIGGKEYQFVVGSLNEPVAVDDKSGVELMLSVAPPDDDDEQQDESVPHEHAGGAPVEGAEATLKVEVSAGDKKKVFDLKPQFGAAGSYAAVFYPTVQTTYSYRFFGTLNNTPVDVTFTCNPAGHTQTPADMTPVELSPGVKRMHKSGAFGCPTAKADLGFPEPSATLVDMQSGESSTMGMIGAITGVLGLILGAAAYARAGKKTATM